MKNLNVLMTFTVLALAGCGSPPPANVKVGDELESGTMTFLFTLASKGQLYILQKITQQDNCPKLRERLYASVRPESGGNRVPAERVCDKDAGGIAITTKTSLPKGNYYVEVKRDESSQFDGKPVVWARYEDPSFNSGPDSLIDGAKELAPGGSVKGTVSYATGNPTTWIRLKGRNIKTGLTLIQNPDAKGVIVQLYEVSAPGKAPKLVAALASKKKRMVKIKDDNVLVKVTARSLDGQGEYSLVRSDAAVVAGAKAEGPMVNVPVIDCYRVGEHSSIVLLQSVAGMKVNDPISVYGKKMTGESVALGSCSVTSIVGGQASCKMDEAVANGFVEYRAEGRGAVIAGSEG
jgi:hypothetical protein